MIETTIASRYARALVLLAQEQNKVDAFLDELRTFINLNQTCSELLPTLANKGFDMSARIRVLDNLFLKMNLSDNVKTFLKLLVRKGRVELISLVVDEYARMADKLLGRCPMIVLSAVELPQTQYEELISVFEKRFGKKMILNKKIDVSVMGGARVQVGDQIFDYTLSRQLNDLKQKMAS